MPALAVGTTQIHGSLSTGQRFSNDFDVVAGRRCFPLFISIGKGTDVFAGSLSFGPTRKPARSIGTHAGTSGVVLASTITSLISPSYSHLDEGNPDRHPQHT